MNVLIAIAILLIASLAIVELAMLAERRWMDRQECIELRRLWAEHVKRLAAMDAQPPADTGGENWQ